MAIIWKLIFVFFQLSADHQPQDPNGDGQERRDSDSSVDDQNRIDDSSRRQVQRRQDRAAADTTNDAVVERANDGCDGIGDRKNSSENYFAVSGEFRYKRCSDTYQSYFTFRKQSKSVGYKVEMIN